MSLEITLEWRGPFDLASHDHRVVFAPPTTSGIYLWTVAAHRVSYVGEATNLANRFYQHVFSMLGGAYCLYDEDHLSRETPPVPVYRPSQESLFTTFFDDFDRHSRLAFRNLVSYRFWWATVDDKRKVRQAIESALIEEARQRGEPIQNDRVSRGPSASVRLRITSVFQTEDKVKGISGTIQYGKLNTGV